MPERASGARLLCARAAIESLSRLPGCIRWEPPRLLDGSSWMATRCSEPTQGLPPDPRPAACGAPTKTASSESRPAPTRSLGTITPVAGVAGILTWPEPAIVRHFPFSGCTRPAAPSRTLWAGTVAFGTSSFRENGRRTDLAHPLWRIRRLTHAAVPSIESPPPVFLTPLSPIPSPSGPRVQRRGNARRRQQGLPLNYSCRRPWWACRFAPKHSRRQPLRVGCSTWNTTAPTVWR